MAPRIRIPTRQRAQPRAQHLAGGRTVECKYDFTDPTGRVLFQKVRYVPKTFGYLNPREHNPAKRYRKPEGADGIIYNLPAVLRAILAGEPIHWTEGEKDADALIQRGHVATTVHQGANKVTLAQAAWLRGASEVYIWVDKDKEHPEVGAHDAAMRHDLLVEVGCTAEISFAKAAGAWALKDVFDHFAAGHGLEDAVAVDPAKLSAVASRYTPSMGWRAGYVG